MADAADRRLPLVSVRSGQPADGYLGVPVGLGFGERIVWSVTRRSAGRPVVQLPLTEPEFDQVMRLRGAERSGAMNAVVFVALGLALARFPVLLPLGMTIGAVSILMVLGARFSLARVVPAVDVRRGMVTIEGAHADFVASVERGGRRYS